MNNGIHSSYKQNYLIDIFEALAFASYKHRHQKRKGAAGIPYINHPIEVTLLLLKQLENPSKEVIIAALLHDLLEDTGTTQDEIQTRFGSKVLELVNEVSDDMNLSSRRRKEMQILKVSTLSSEAQSLKIADKTCNIRDILTTRVYWTRKQKIHYIEWAVKVISQIGNAHNGLLGEFNTAVKAAETALKHTFRSEF